MRTYHELIELPTFLERYRYLRLGGAVGDETFGFDRWLNQVLYKSIEWKRVRRDVILRDSGYGRAGQVAFDLACEGYELQDGIIVHHMNPITRDDIIQRRAIVFDPEFLITTSDNTHKAIHFGDESLLPVEPVERRPNDTCPWRA